MIATNLTLADKRSVQLLEWHQAGAPATRAVLCLHGMESHSGWFATLAEGLTAQGIAVYAFDRRGWGQSPGRRGHVPSLTSACDSISQVVDHIRSRHADVHLVGMSWGGLLGLYYSMRHPQQFLTLTLLAPGFYPKNAPSWPSILKITLKILAGNIWQVRLPYTPNEFTLNLQWQAYIARDPLRVQSVSPSFFLSTLVMRRFVRKHLGQSILPPTRVLLAENDAIINNVATTAALKHPQIRISYYPEAAHTLIFEDIQQVSRDIGKLVLNLDCSSKVSA